MPDLLPIVFSLDNNYVKPFSTAVASILENSLPSTHYEFNALTTFISKENREKIEALIARYPGSKVHFIDMKKVLAGLDLNQLMSYRKGYTYISIEAYFRFFIPQLFPQHKKVLYLDADLLVLDDLQGIFDYDISNYCAGVIKDYFGASLIKNTSHKLSCRPDMDFNTYLKTVLKKKTGFYFNAGVLLLNLEKMKRDGVQQKLIKFAYANQPLEFIDQCVINAVLESHVKRLDDRWNVFADNPSTRPAIIHYVGKSKPWNSENYDFVQWAHYAKKTPYWTPGDEIKLRRRRRRQKLLAWFSLKNIWSVSIAGKGRSIHKH